MERAMGLEPITVCLEGRDSSHWATPAIHQNFVEFSKNEEFEEENIFWEEFTFR